MSADQYVAGILLFAGIAMLVGYSVGSWVGLEMGRYNAGRWLGLSFGPLGWILVAVLPMPPATRARYNRAVEREAKRGA